MRVLVFNAGSSSLKFKLLNPESNEVFAQGVVDAIRSDRARMIYRDALGTHPSEVDAPTITAALDLVLERLVSSTGPLSSLRDVDAIGHRIAHGGELFSCSVEIDETVIKVIEDHSHLAPLHNPAALAVIGRCQDLFTGTLQVAAFDTAFHQTMPPRNYVYPIPYRYYRDYGIRRFGFHGMSHKYVSRKAAEYLGKNPRDLKMITCHLGAGASLCAIDHGISMDTSMGYTPLDGIMMGTRSGSVDPAIITAIMDKEGLSPSEMDQILNRESGMLGVSGVSGDLRRLKEAVAIGDDQAELAYDIFLTSIRRMIGAYFFELAGVDVIVCTAGVGENDSYARRLIFRGLEPFGIRIDQRRNSANENGVRLISSDDSQVAVLVVPTDEEAEIARDTYLISQGIDISDPWSVFN